MKKKYGKKTLSLLLAVIVLLGLFAANPLAVNATSKTAEQAISWCQSKLGTGVEYSIDEYRYQCVDFIQAYYSYLGVSPSYGSGYQYATNTLPSGWTRTYGGKPQKGDILVYTGGYGHVAIYESDYVSYHQNWGGPYVQKVERYYGNSVWVQAEGVTKTYWGCIHPNFTNPVPKPTNAWIKQAHTSIPTGTTNTFTFGATNASWYNIRIDKDGALWKFEQGISSGKSYTFADEGNYTVFIAGYNSAGYSDSSKLSFAVFEPVLLGRDFVANITNAKAAKNISADSNDNVILQNKSDSDYQRWHFKLQSDNTYKITNVATGKNLDVYNADTANGTNIQIWKDNNTSAQYFYIRYNNSGFGIIPKANTSAAVDIANGYFDNGTNIQEWNWNASNAQTFSVDGYFGTTPVTTSTYSGHTYEYYDVETTWNQAYRICENKGGHLVTITTKEENDFIYNLCKDYCSLIWIGANVFNREPTKENWYWITGEPFSYDGWNTGEPNFDQSIERYGVMFISTGNIGTWNDTGLNSSTYFYRHNMVRGFVCEYDNGDVNAEQYNATARTEMNGTAYEVFDYAVDWQTAAAICEAKGGHLVVVDSNTENETIVALANRGKKSEYWINATDRFSEGVWTDNNGNSLAFTNWLSGEPNNDFNAEQYAAIQKSEGKWCDFKGFSSMYRSVGFICEYDPERKVELTLYSMNSANDYSSFNFDYGEIIETLPIPFIENFEFLGWYTKPNGGEKINLPYTITNDTELFAHWQNNQVPSTEHPQSNILGDVDGDGEVSIFDATAIQRKVADLATTAFVESAADADGDGSITVLDATAIQRHLAGLSTNAKGIGEPIQ